MINNNDNSTLFLPSSMIEKRDSELFSQTINKIFSDSNSFEPKVNTFLKHLEKYPILSKYFENEEIILYIMSYVDDDAYRKSILKWFSKLAFLSSEFTNKICKLDLHDHILSFYYGSSKEECVYILGILGCSISDHSDVIAPFDFIFYILNQLPRDRFESNHLIVKAILYTFRIFCNSYKCNYDWFLLVFEFSNVIFSDFEYYSVFLTEIFWIATIFIYQYEDACAFLNENGFVKSSLLILGSESLVHLWDKIFDFFSCFIIKADERIKVDINPQMLIDIVKSHKVPNSIISSLFNFVSELMNLKPNIFNNINTDTFYSLCSGIIEYGNFQDKSNLVKLFNAILAFSNDELVYFVLTHLFDFISSFASSSEYCSDVIISLKKAIANHGYAFFSEFREKIMNFIDDCHYESMPDIDMTLFLDNQSD